MSFWTAALLGVVQGLTEFLPVSSSGHLVIAQSLMGNFEQPGVAFDAVLHAGTTLAVLVYFRERIMRMDKKYLGLLIIGTVPAGVMGVIFYKVFEVLFRSVELVGVALMVTGVINVLTDRAMARRENPGYFDALLVGVAQAIAIVPGISRSGATIFAGVSLGIDRRRAAEYSFLLSVPAIIGANVMEMYLHGAEMAAGWGDYAAGMAGAFVAAMAAIGIVLRVLTGRKFRAFGVYCIVLGVAVLLVL